MDTPAFVQPLSLIERIRVLLRAHTDERTILECRIAVALLIDEKAGRRGLRHLAICAGVSRDYLAGHLPAPGQTSPHGLIRCTSRGRWAPDPDDCRPSKYTLAGDWASLTTAEKALLAFISPDGDYWTDHRCWALGVLYGRGNDPVEVTTAELNEITGTRRRAWLLVRRLEDLGLLGKVGRGRFLLLFHINDPDGGPKERAKARYAAIRAEAVGWRARYKLWMHKRIERIQSTLIGGTLELARHFDPETTPDDLLGIPLGWQLDDDERAWVRNRDSRWAVSA